MAKLVIDPFSPLSHLWITREAWLHKIRFLPISGWDNPRPLDPAVAGAIAALARASNAERLSKAVSCATDAEWWWHIKGSKEAERQDRKAKGWERRARVQLRHIARDARKLHALLQKLDKEALDLLGHFAEEDLDVLGAEFDSIAPLLEALSGAASRTRHRLQLPPAKFTCPAWMVKLGPGSFQRFTLYLLWDVKAAGGKLSLDKNAGTGTLIDALERLRTQLPPGFVPAKLPISKLAACKALDKRIPFSELFAQKFSVQ